MAAHRINKTISPPPELARKAEEIARAEGKTLSAVVEEALALRRAEQLKREFSAAQNYWSGKAREKGILTERDLQPYLGS
jgi:predicted transcriptional regulator